MSIFILGLLDVIAGAFLAFTSITTFTGNAVVFWLSVVFLIKAASSLIGAVLNSFYFDILGLIDLLAALFLFLAQSGTVFGFFLWVGVALIIKGLYSAGIWLME